MQFPTLYTKESASKTMDVLAGYNHNLRISDGEFYDMKNLTSDHYPVLAPRGARGVYATPASPQGMIAKDKLCYVDGSAFVIGEERIEMGLSVEEADCPKRMISMGAYVLIMPDKKYINTMDTAERGDIETSFSTQTEVTFTLCTVTGEEYADPVISPDEPDDPENLDYWIDTSTTPHALKQFSEASGMWVSIATTYVKISATGIGAPFAQYDGVVLSGIQSEELKSLNASMVIWERGDDYIVVAGILDKVTTQVASITVSRQMPNMDYMTECGNRIWGCRYGTDRNGEVVNEIYACKLGDFKNWNCFMGLSTDSWVGAVGTNGPFTGAVTHLGFPVFFKENCLHKVYISSAGAHQVQDTACRGVQNGCDRSLAIVNELLLYKSRSGICAFDGSLPAEVSYALGNGFYSNAVGGALGNKYYVSMQDTDGTWHVFVYDTVKSMWHKEDNLHAGEFCTFQGELYCIDGDRKNIITMLGSGTKDSAQVDWMAETGELGMSSPDMKYVSRLIIRMAMDADSQMDIYAQYDLSPEWLHICNIRGTSLRSFSVPIRPRRCDHMRIRMEGCGNCRIYSITKIITQGSDVS